MGLDEFRPLAIKAGTTLIAEGQRVRVQGSRNMTLLPDFFVVDVYNLTEDDIAALNDSRMLSVYGQDERLICSGEVDDIYTALRGVNEVSTLSVVDGKSFWETKIAKAVGGGSSVKTTYEKLIENASIGEFNANDVRMIRGQTYSGRLADCISMLAKSVHARAYITNNTVYVSAKGRSAEKIVLDDADIINSYSVANGVKVIKTILKGYPIGAIVVFDNKQYRLVSQKIDGDNFEGAWDSHLILVNEKEISEGGMEGG